MTFRAVATDLDGTLLRSDQTLSARNLAALRAFAASGGTVVVATGRPPRWVHGLGLETVAHEYVLCANGAIVYEPAAHRIVRERRIAEDVAREVVSVVTAACPGAGFASEAGLDFRYEPSYGPRSPVPPDALVDSRDDVVRGGVAKLLVRHPDLRATEMAARLVETVGDLAVIAWSSDTLLEITAPGVTKASALADLVDAEGTVAFGDMPNDVGMLQWAARGVAVANAHPDVLAVADEVTASNDDDGVALVIERMMRP